MLGVGLRDSKNGCMHFDHGCSHHQQNNPAGKCFSTCAQQKQQQQECQ